MKYRFAIFLWSVVVTQLTTTEPARRRLTGSTNSWAGAETRGWIAVMTASPRPPTIPTEPRRSYPLRARNQRGHGGGHGTGHAVPSGDPMGQASTTRPAMPTTYS